MSNPRVRTWLPLWAAMLLAAVFLISGCIIHEHRRPRARHSRCPPGKVLVQGKHGKWKCKKPKKHKHKRH